MARGHDSVATSPALTLPGTTLAGATGEALGEVCFNTAMSGYQGLGEFERGISMIRFKSNCSKIRLCSNIEIRHWLIRLAYRGSDV
jgi:hypothetical protein